MVDGQIHLVQIDLGVVGKEPPGGDVHRHHGVGHKGVGSQQPLQVGREERGGLGVGQNMGGLARLAQGQTEPGGAAHRVAIGPHVGQNEIVVMGAQKIRCLLWGHGIHSSSRWMCSLAGLAGLTMSGLRSISRMWAP